MLIMPWVTFKRLVCTCRCVFICVFMCVCLCVCETGIIKCPLSSQWLWVRLWLLQRWFLQQVCHRPVKITVFCLLWKFSMSPDTLPLYRLSLLSMELKKSSCLPVYVSTLSGLINVVLGRFLFRSIGLSIVPRLVICSEKEQNLSSFWHFHQFVYFSLQYPLNFLTF